MIDQSSGTKISALLMVAYWHWQSLNFNGFFNLAYFWHSIQIKTVFYGIKKKKLLLAKYRTDKQIVNCLEGETSEVVSWE